MALYRKKPIVVVPYADSWAVKRAGVSRPIYVLRTESDAIDVARQIARNQRSELIVLSAAVGP